MDRAPQGPFRAPALVASIAWLGKDGDVTSVNVWDSPQAVGDFYMERVGPIVQAGASR